MNYDMWQDLWVRQPVPLPPPEEGRLLREIQAESEKEDDGRRQFLNAALCSAAIFAVLSLYPLIRHGFELQDWFPFLLWGSWAGIGLVFRQRRRTLDRGYGESLLDRIDHAQAILRESQRYAVWNMIVPVLVTVVMVAHFAAEITEGQSILAPVLAGGLVLLLPLLALPWERKRRDKLRQRMAELQEMRAQLSSGAEAK